ncbi:MAG TPA: family 10 glycosylhydrolase [Rhodothermales bacterium]|nr:family 10 glycosylhydrolase [Rhodothermales bacterium]
MRIRRTIFVVLLCGLGTSAASQPLFETRAVWLTTASGLDWPQTGAGHVQQESDLRDLIAGARSRGLNTIFFQVVTRGDAFYRSERLPWSGILTGAAGADPGFDPLAVAIEAAHEHGMELHAWINTYRIAKATTGPFEPNHVTEDHAEWTEVNGNWLNPGYPGVNDWIVANVSELVERYDVDAVHFDFARYNQGGYIRDDSLFLATNPSGIATKNDWRRENVNNLMRAVKDGVFALKPWMKIGSTPIGSYDESCFAGALTGFGDVFQDSRLWLSEGTNDYLAPQLYWADGEANSPSFTCLVTDWVDENSSRHIYPGIAIYKPEVVRELSNQIDVTRSKGAQGVAFFREAFTRSEDFGGRFDALSLPPPTTLRFEAQAPETPDSVSVSVDGPRLIHIEWTPAQGTQPDPVGWYAIFKRSGSHPDASDANDLAAVVYRDRISYDDVLPASETGPVYYSIVAISRLGFLADPTEPVSTGQLPVSAEREVPIGPLAVEGIYPNPAADRISIRFAADASRVTQVRVVDQLGRVVYQRTVRSAIGQNVMTVPVSRFAAGMYLLELTSGKHKNERTFVVAK